MKKTIWRVALAIAMAAAVALVSTGCKKDEPVGPNGGGNNDGPKTWTYKWEVKNNDLDGTTEEKQARLNAENKMAWALKGEVQMNERDWDNAVESYKKAIEIDPTFIQCIFNAGVCLNGKAIDLKDKLADKNTGGLTKANADKVKAILTDALSFLERAKELDPDREKVNWAYPLYQIYYSLGNKAKSDEMEALVNAGR